jgi:hypothetical protein
MKVIAFALFILMANAVQSSAQVVRSGNDIREACEILIQPGGQRGDVEHAKAGYCLGFVSALLFTGHWLAEPDNFCPPVGVTVDQAIRVFLKYLNENPDRTHGRSEVLGRIAFSTAWPCK